MPTKRPNNVMMSTPQTLSSLVTPSSRRRSSFGSPGASFLPPSTLNDDDAEKKERRRSRILELRRHVSSPASPQDKRRSITPLNGLSNNQLTDHYANCIKLSAENKINAKNAFGLHLIDYMQEVLSKKEQTNFQVASSTLDASAKIYAGRVDAIHTETYKVLTGLGRTDNKEKGPEEGADGDLMEGERKPKRARKSNTIETNLKNINVNKFDLEFEVDPLFQKTSAAFDEGGTGGLLLNHLRCLDDSSALVLDSNTIAPGFEDRTGEVLERGKFPIDMRELQDLYGSMRLEALKICPSLEEFEFMNWKKEQSTISGFLGQTSLVGRNEHAFDMDAEPDVPTTDLNDEQLCDEITGNMSYGDDHEDVESCASAMPSDKVITFGDGEEAQMVQSTMADVKSGGTIGTLMKVLASEPSDYSYFDSDALRTWAGPEHWKLKPKSKDGANAKGSEQSSSEKSKKKEAFKLDFTEEINFDKHLKETRASTTLTKTTLDKYSKSQITLPADLHYKAEDLFKPFLQPFVLLRRLNEKAANMDQSVANYDYNRAVDTGNFCPLPDADDEDNEEPLGSATMDFNVSNDVFSQTQDVNSTFQGDNLVAPPNKVAKIDIGYAKTAKKMDVKKLKSSIWTILTKEEKEEQASGTKPEKECQECSFQGLLDELPQKVSKTMASNLSVPITFVCLLHLANEKSLSITSDQTLSDLTITQG